MKAVFPILQVTLLFAGLTINAEEGMSAKEFAARVSAGLTDGASFVRLRMENSGEGKKGALQLQLKQRRTKSGSDILYQVLYPKERKGESVLLQKHGGSVTGKTFVPPSTVQNIASMKDPMLGSALSYEDVIENFFAWDQQSLAGTEEVNRTNCQILESKPGKGDHSSYGRVRSWIDTKKMVPLRVEKYSSSGQLLRRIQTTRVASDDTDRPVVASLTVQHGSSVSEIEGSDSKHDVEYSDADFSAEGIQKLTPPRSK